MERHQRASGVWTAKRELKSNGRAHPSCAGSANPQPIFTPLWLKRVDCSSLGRFSFTSPDTQRCWAHRTTHSPAQERRPHFLPQPRHSGQSPSLSLQPERRFHSRVPLKVKPQLRSVWQKKPLRSTNVRTVCDVLEQSFEFLGFQPYLPEMSYLSFSEIAACRTHVATSYEISQQGADPEPQSRGQINRPNRA